MTKITIISGFLGAGKTTLIKKLLNGPLRREKTALIENDYGDINIDGTFLAETGIEMREIMSGCICCTLAGDFSAALLELKKTYEPDRILIEPSGVGRLTDVIRAVETVTNDPANDMEICSTLTVVDVTLFDLIDNYFGEFYKDQIEKAGAVYISHIDDEECTPESLEAAAKGIRSLNPQAVLITTPVDVLGADAFWEAVDGRTGSLKQFVKIAFGGLAVTPNAAPSVSIADDKFNTWSSVTTRAFGHRELEAILKKLLADASLGTVLRAKGAVAASDGAEASPAKPDREAVLWYHFDLTPGRYEIRRGTPGPTGQICVIGSGLDTERVASLFSDTQEACT